MSREHGVPPLVATYRLQLHRGFTFGDAAAVVPYLGDLGISHLYLSPVFQAVPGSTHGYDQCDPARLSDDLGGDAGFRDLVAAAGAHGLGIVLDVVPNHMAAGEQNPWWWELLRDGRQGARGRFFDIDWEDPDPGLHGRVMLPVLAAPLADVLGRGEIEIRADRRGPVMTYGDARFPINGATDGASVADVVGRQNYVLTDWREGLVRLNYRRFFAVNDLVALRQEDPTVFHAVHDRVLQMLRDGDVQGLRVDHVDGLRDPAAYLRQLRAAAGECWLLVEKILEPGEALADGWPVAGTTGYDFMHRVTGVFVDPAGEAPLTALYQAFTGSTASYREVVNACKREAVRRLFAPDVARLARLLVPLCRGRGVIADTGAAARAVEALAVGLRVYRTYLPELGQASDLDRERIAAAQVAAAGAADPQVLGVLADALVRRDSPGAADLAGRFQQLTGPVMAKGVEDTAYYRYNRLVCLNEVGGDPGVFGVTPGAFHAANLRAAAAHPTAMLASTTHDTKRGEDARARLTLLAQVPERWAAAVRRWSVLNRQKEAAGGIDRETEYLLYQALVGAWPISVARAQAYIEKATREAARRTSWVDPDGAFEDAVRRFVADALGDPAFTRDVEAFVAPLVAAGERVALAQCLLKLTAPGVPDFYQGAELWDLSLVDPDNRRPVDFGRRRALLAAAPDADALGSTSWQDGLVKLNVVRESLATRRRHPAAFAAGSTYTPLLCRGPAAEHVLGFARGTAADPLMVVTLVPRLALRDGIDWDSIEVDLGPGTWSDALWDGARLAGPTIRAGQVLARWPVGLLERVGAA